MDGRRIANYFRYVIIPLACTRDKRKTMSRIIKINVIYFQLNQCPTFVPVICLNLTTNNI